LPKQASFDSVIGVGILAVALPAVCYFVVAASRPSALP
jgi:hypothetical protein